MVDAAHLAYADERRHDGRRGSCAHAAGLWVEAELGEIGGKDGAHAPGVRTDPAEAASFVAATGVDGLAVAVGSSHAMATRDATLDLELIARSQPPFRCRSCCTGRRACRTTCSSEAVPAGIRKVNVGTALNVAYTGSVRPCLDGGPRPPIRAGTSRRRATPSRTSSPRPARLRARSLQPQHAPRVAA